MELNHQEAKRRPLDDMSQGYKERGKTIEPETKSEADRLREAFEKDPESLSPNQRLTLAFANLSQKDEKTKGNADKAADKDGKTGGNDGEMVSTKSKEFEELAQQMAAMQKMFSELNGGGGE